MFVQGILDLSSQSRQQTSRAQAHPLAFNQDLIEKKLNVAEMNGNIKIGRNDEWSRNIGWKNDQLLIDWEYLEDSGGEYL